MPLDELLSLIGDWPQTMMCFLPGYVRSRLERIFSRFSVLRITCIQQRE
jgi:hypothetical protein